MPNPSGQNSPVNFDGFVQNIPYGDKQRQGDLQRSAPVAGGSAAASPINAPRRAQRRATRPSTTTSAAAGTPIVAPPPASDITPQATYAQLWQQIAATPGASPLVQQLAQEAQGGG